MLLVLDEDKKQRLFLSSFLDRHRKSRRFLAKSIAYGIWLRGQTYLGEVWDVLYYVLLADHDISKAAALME